MLRIILAVTFLLGLAGAAHACPVPNPNLMGPPNLVDNCPVPASVLNKALPTNVATNAALIAINTSAFTANQQITRQGFGAAGDGGNMTYLFSTSACSLSAGAGDNGSQVKPTTGGGCWIANVKRKTVNLQVWGAICDGTTDDSTAITNAVAYAAANASVIQLPVGTCAFATAQTWDTANAGNWGMVGTGPYRSKLLYTGASTTNDIITVGNSVPTGHASINDNFVDFKLDSSTQMTAGTAFHAYGLARSKLDHVIFSGQDGNNKFNNGLWFDVADNVVLDNFEISGGGIGDGLRINGNAAGTFGADVFINHGKMGNFLVGLHLGGGLGGFVCSNTDLIVSGTNVLIDNALSGAANREDFFGDTCIVDSAGQSPGPVGNSENFRINDTVASGNHIMINGWVSASHAAGIHVVSWPNSNITIGGYVAVNTTDGILVDDATSYLKISASAFIHGNLGYGVNCSTAVTRIWSATEPVANGNSPFATNCGVENLTSANGFRFRSDGIIEQWIQTTFTGAADTVLASDITLPMAFPNTMMAGSIVCGPVGFANANTHFAASGTPVGLNKVHVSLIAGPSTVTSAQTVNCRVLGN